MLCEPGISKQDTTDFLRIIGESIKTFRSVITDISVIAKVESDMAITENVNLDELIDNIEWSLKDQIANSGVKIIRKFKVKNIVFSKKNMRSILFNLISNAIKFRSQLPPVIKINTFKENDSYIITVEDNGQGIPKAAMEKIFDLYGRLHQDIEGTGVGLYLAKKIINAAAGTITVESQPGTGTKFCISLTQGKINRESQI